jgi:hypothetical protein
MVHFLSATRSDVWRHVGCRPLWSAKLPFELVYWEFKRPNELRQDKSNEGGDLLNTADRGQRPAAEYAWDVEVDSAAEARRTTSAFGAQ